MIGKMNWKERELDYIPYDVYEDGTWYKSTGIACQEPTTGEWWNEYESDDGVFIYRR